jgi:hypothetical protein
VEAVADPVNKGGRRKGGGVAIMGRRQAGCFGLGPIGTVQFAI